MKITKTPIEDLLIIEPHVYEDDRGYFMESYNKFNFMKKISNVNFVQDNESKSSYGILRGLHFQKSPYEQTKLVRVVKGEVLDVAVDLRENSTTFLQHFSIKLSCKNKKQLLVPRGFAHGFITLSESAIFSYKVDNYHSKDHDSGIRYNDPKLEIDWIIPKTDIKVSAKDKNLDFIK